MKLLNEANVDMQFNKYMDALQNAIIGLENTLKAFKKENVKPINSQKLMVEVAIEDLEKIKKTLSV